MHRKLTSAAALLLASLALAPAFADSLAVKDAASATKNLRVHTNSDTTLSYVHAMQDSAEAIIDPATKQLQQSTITALGSPFQAGGSIANTAFGISGTLPAFAATPTFNIGTAPTLTFSNTGFGITGTLPAFAATPTFNLGTAPSLTIGTLPALAAGSNTIGTVNLGTLNGAATAASQTNVQSAPGTSATTAITVQGSASGVAIPVAFATNPANVIGKVGNAATVVPCGASPCFVTTTSTTAYSYNQAIAPTTAAFMTFNVCSSPGGTATISRARIRVATDAGYVNTPVMLYLYRVAPTTLPADHAAYATNDSEMIGRMGATMKYAFTDDTMGIAVPEEGTAITVVCASGSQAIYGLLASGGNITPAVASAKAVTVALEAVN